MSLLSELKRRNVFRVATFYAVAAWVLLQAGDLLFSALDVPPWAIKLLLGLLLLGFPFAILFSWAFELTPEGLKREHEVHRDASITAQTATKLNILIAGLLVIAIGLGVANWLGDPNDAGRAQVDATTQQAAPPVPQVAGASDANGTADVSIAVLPFVNTSDEKANEYFSDGLTEELLNVLANVQGLRVIARTSSFAYKGKDVKIADVARELSVDHVLEGSVRKSGNKVRITTQLIRASDSSHLWSDTYDRSLEDIFAVQDEISGQVVDALKLKLLADGHGPSDVGGTRDTQAYEAFLLGRHLSSQGEKEESLRAAVKAFDDALRIDPGYAQAYVGKASVLQRLASNAYIPFDVGFEQCRQAALRSLELAPDLAEGRIALAQVQMIVDANVSKAAASAERAVQSNPGSELVQRLYSQIMATLGRHDRAVDAAQAAVRLDPISAESHTNLSNVFYGARRYSEAEAAARRALTLLPGRSSTQGGLGLALLQQGRLDEALIAINAETVDWQRVSGRALIFAKTGKAAEARRELAALQAKFGDNASYQYAQIEAQLGDKDAALRWLHNARRVRDPGLVGVAFVDPMLDPLRGDPRFEQLLRDLGFVKETSTGA